MTLTGAQTLSFQPKPLPGRLGPVGRALAAYAAFIAASMLCFGATTLLSLLP